MSSALFFQVSLISVLFILVSGTLHLCLSVISLLLIDNLLLDFLLHKYTTAKESGIMCGPLVIFLYRDYIDLRSM
ncbi:hypothetical protein BDV41DRAFT_60265 [Aspergillus transmontanensis]|uniref:Uncharacterized protein n=1 Tax=Aspergillus transmontanensis TaxID=1034304 RepID=A0A5N6VFT6_9EURO|nr:hypothetical protein BDV41DRAFT_60265 [Aspergillus transmontanensis]